MQPVKTIELYMLPATSTTICASTATVGSSKHLLGIRCDLGSLPGGLDGKAFACNVGHLVGSVLGSEKSPGEGNSNPLWYSCLENSMDGGAW